MSQFPQQLPSSIARFIAFVAGSFAALLLLVTLLDETLLERPLGGRHIVWWLAALGVVLTASRWARVCVCGGGGAHLAVACVCVWRGGGHIMRWPVCVCVCVCEGGGRLSLTLSPLRPPLPPLAPPTPGPSSMSSTWHMTPSSLPGLPPPLAPPLQDLH